MLCWSIKEKEEPTSSPSGSDYNYSAIAVALPNISDHCVKQLLTAVSEGLSFVKLIENTSGDLLSIRNAADAVWVDLELYQKWQNEKIREKARDKTYMQIFQELSCQAKEIIVEFKTTNTNNVLMQSPLNWPVNVIAANSMYRICQTLLLVHGDGNNQTIAEKFESLSVIISDILAACLTNLSHIMTIKCQSIDINDRVESLRRAAVLLGESEEVLQLLEQRGLSNLDPLKAAYLDEWRAFMEHDVENPLISDLGSSNETALPKESNGQHVPIEDQINQMA